MTAGGDLVGPELLSHPLSAAFIAAVHEDGHDAVDLTDLLTEVGMARAEFDLHFDGRDDLALKVFEAFIADYRERVGGAFESAPTWPDKLRAAAYEAARWIRDHPLETWFGMVGVLEAGEMARVRREEVFKWSAGLIDAGRAVAPDPEAVPPMAAIVAVGAIAETLRRQQEGTLSADIVETVPEMMYGAVRPYLGEAAARRELSIPPPVDLGERRD